jgi:glycosyltransferase involved in cell wall biosynthesis
MPPSAAPAEPRAAPPTERLRLSIVATVRNEAATIQTFVDSLLGQSRAPDEIVIVDGASTDGTVAILQAYAAHGAIRLVSEPCNIAEGRNRGIAAAQGTHLAVTDSGCRVDPHWLREIERCFLSAEAPDVVAGNFRFDVKSPFEHAVVLATFPPNRDQTEGARHFPSSRSVAFTKAAWQAAGGYPEWLYAAEDTLFNIRLRQVGMRFAFCPTAVVYWRPRENWRALARQRINFARGNARVGIGEAGYRLNLKLHGAILVMLLASAWTPWLLVPAGATFLWHVRRHLWPQARQATRGQRWPMLVRVITVMEFVRLVNLWGYLRGRWERATDPKFVDRQKAYMGVSSVQELEWV